ncbi:MAG: SsrA-binding protein SmpB [Propionibacteriaceae bacterium]
MPREKGKKLIAQNKKAHHDYHVGERLEAGMVLQGTEVKSLRLGRASLVDSFATIDNGEVWLRQAHIPEYSHGTWTNHAARRNRKLLLHRREISKLEKALQNSGATLVPLAMYFSDGYAKVELAVVTGKKEWDKRQTIAKRDADRDIARAVSTRLKRRGR